jgi:hypothetical protein
MVKSKKKKNKGAGTAAAAAVASAVSSSTAPSSGGNAKKDENLDDLAWLRECEVRNQKNGEPYLQLEYQDDDELVLLLQRFLEESAATVTVIDAIYHIWQQTVLSTLLQSSAVWKKDNVTATDQRTMKDTLKLARYKINFIMHHVTGSILTHPAVKWAAVKELVIEKLCYNTLQLVPRLAESCPHHKTDIRATIIHFEGKEFLAAVACETWDTLYDYSIQIDPDKFLPVLRRCAMLDCLDKDWNMLGGWGDILKGLEAKCCSATGTLHRLPSDTVLHEHTTILRNARNSMQCKFFSVRFMRYTVDQAPQRWRYFPKCSAPACSHIETAERPHPHRCHKCWYFHYCSAACQEYCDNIMGLHPKFCKDTPAAKAALCQKETEQYLGWNSSADNAKDKDDTDPVLTCQACGAVEKEVDGDKSKMKRCQHCRAVVYCSKQCQEWDWRVGGHRDVCKGNNGSDEQEQQNGEVAELN